MFVITIAKSSCRHSQEESYLRLRAVRGHDLNDQFSVERDQLAGNVGLLRRSGTDGQGSVLVDGSKVESSKDVGNVSIMGAFIYFKKNECLSMLSRGKGFGLPAKLTRQRIWLGRVGKLCCFHPRWSWWKSRRQ